MMNQEWIVRWENGKTLRFVPYDSYGMSSFIVAGLKRGAVTVNEEEVELTDDKQNTWKYKDRDTRLV